MSPTIKRVVRASILLSLASCGGGGGSDVQDFSGVYELVIHSQDTSCPFAFTSPSRVSISQSEKSITAINGGAEPITLAGSVTDIDAAVLTTDTQIQCFNADGSEARGSTSRLTATFAITRFDGERGNVDYFLGYGNCTGENTGGCSYEIHGTLIRQ